MDKRLEQAIRFHQEWGAYCTPPGRMVCAKRAAQAELWAEDLDYTFEWEDDEDGFYYWEQNGQKFSECWQVLLRDDSGHVVESLGGVLDPDRNYTRSVEANLSLEHFGPAIDYGEQLDVFLARIV